jgi:putative membrane-bound dehydrogenase-like protein
MANPALVHRDLRGKKRHFANKITSSERDAYDVGAAVMLRFSILGVLGICLGLASIPDQMPGPANDIGVLPVGADGKALNLDFETGTLKDWTAEGEAFKGQPIKGDTVARRRADNKSQHQGDYWIGSYEKSGDQPQGTLTSVPFRVTHPWASFLVGGGPWPETCVELVRKDTGNVFFRVSGIEEENLRRVVVDLKALQGKEIFIRLVDRHSGHWGHINFDDFRFHTEKPSFPQRPASLTPDVYKYAGLEPKKAAEVMTVPDGFSVKLFAGEPDVKQPIAFCIDDRGRLWVVEAYSYPQRQPEGKGKDRILIFEDSQGTGTFDKRTVFMEGLNLVSGIELGFGGVWIGAAPYLMFIPIKEGEDKPAGEPKILLDGWGWQDTHETLNTFTWGPDGWLYGCHGVFTHSKVGKPGTPDKDRVPLNAGIWRYHPTKHLFEVFAEGTSNPWGLDFDEHGQAFVEACVIPHNWHIIQGARYQRQAGNHFNPYTYADIPTVAEHRHYVGATPHGGNGKSDSVGGGHAHSGTMIYQGGAWPKEYDGKMFMGNIHGHRLNIDVLAPSGSGFIARSHLDFLLSHDSWAMFVNLQSGPDGNAFVIDWYDRQSCHTGNPQMWDRSNGRIYKICYKDAQPVAGIDLNRLTDKELIELQVSENQWYVRHSRRLLQERAAQSATRRAAIQEAIGQRFGRAAHVDYRMLWALHVTGGLTPRFVALPGSTYFRAWMIQLALEDKEPSPMMPFELMEELAKDDPSPVVRLYLASGLQRLQPEHRWGTLKNLVAHAEDATDHNLPLMYWYAAEPLAAKDPGRALDLALASKVPPLPKFMVRRVSSAGTPEAVALVVEKLANAKTNALQLAILRGLQDGLKGRRDVAMPAAWPKAFATLESSNDSNVRSAAVALAVTFGDPKAFAALREVLAKPQVALASRQEALTTLVAARDKQVVPLLHQLLADPALRGPALRGLAIYDDAKTPEKVLAVYATLSSAEKRDALATLASRSSYGKALLDAVASKKVPAPDVSADLVRQLRNLNDKVLDQRIAEVWGIVRATPAERAKQIAEWKRLLTVQTKPADPMLGRAMFAKVCQQCHTLYGVGGKVGPEITGANRASLDYLLENILDPSAVIPKEYTSTIIELKDGRVITGIIKGETPAAYTVVTANETLTIPRGDVDKLKTSELSMMPDDLLKDLSKDQVRALIAYLQSSSQVPLLATPENAKDFFNGKDLAGWDGDATVWKVENGEIVGKSQGLKHQEWLRSTIAAGDFKLSLKVKLVPNAAHAGVHFHSEVMPDGDLKGPLTNIGAGWWGKLQEGQGRGQVEKLPAEANIKVDDWNDLVIQAQGSKVWTWINGRLCAELDDVQLARRGIFALQLQPAPAIEVRFRDMRLELPSGVK